MHSGQKIWLIGASEGIGAALALQLAAAGAQLALSARTAEKLAALAATLPGGPHLALACDVTDLAGIQAAWAHLAQEWGGIDTLIYNAGTYEAMRARTFDLAAAEKMVDTNFSGALRVLSCVLPLFLKRDRAHIVLTGSVAAYSGLPNAIGYGASKAALLHLAENLRAELSGSGILVQLVSPGFVKTRLTGGNKFKMPFLMTAEDAARCIVRGMVTKRFDIHFPRPFSYFLKMLRLLPYRLYFFLVNALL